MLLNTVVIGAFPSRILQSVSRTSSFRWHREQSVHVTATTKTHVGREILRIRNRISLRPVCRCSGGTSWQIHRLESEATVLTHTRSPCSTTQCNVAVGILSVNSSFGYSNLKADNRSPTVATPVYVRADASKCAMHILRCT